MTLFIFSDRLYFYENDSNFGYRISHHGRARTSFYPKIILAADETIVL